MILCEEHRRLAREAARKSFVLLKNEEQILPLKKTEKTAYIGPYVNTRNLMGSWSIIGEAKDVKTIREVLKQENLAENVVFAQGSPMLGEDVVLEGFTEGTQESSCTPQEEAQMLEEAVKAAAGAKKVILCIGEDRLPVRRGNQ